MLPSQNANKMKKVTKKLTLDRPVTYQIKVPGHLDDRRSDWVDNMKIAAETGSGKMPITTLTGSLDQAALLGLLRCLYSLGLPLISVNCLEV